MASPPVSSEPAGATPAMRQYFEAKRQFRDAIVFFRMGDFYEMFYEDALTAARALELTLTSRSKDSTGGAIPMCGVPYHAADGYIARLVKKGFRVAVCEQMEDPKKAKGLVRREVVRVVSPGTLTDAGYLEAREPAFLMGIVAGAGRLGLRGGAARCVDRRVHHARSTPVATARQALADELAVLRPREIVAPAGADDVAALVERAAPRHARHDGGRLDVRVRSRRGGAARADAARSRCMASDSRITARRPCAAGALVQYLRETQKADLAHVRDVTFRTGADCDGHRSDDAARTSRSSKRPMAAGTDRCCTKSIARSRRWAAA